MLRDAAATTVVSRETAGTRVRGLTGEAARALRLHWLFACLLAVGAVLRVLVMVAYPPAVFFNDSWVYLASAFGHHLTTLSSLRPVGYSLLIRLLTIPGRDVSQIVALQHLGGLVIGTLIYATLIRARLPRALAAAAAAFVLLDGYAITLEQYLMPDTFFTLTLLLALLALAWPRLEFGAHQRPRIRARTGMLVGFLLAAAVIQREVALFAVPVVIVYLAWERVGWRPFVGLIVLLALPLGVYAARMDATTGVFGITATSGRTLYSRVAGFADCSGAGIAPNAHPLCETARERASHPRVPSWYMWDAPSPALRLFPLAHETNAERAQANATLGGFARHIILHQPGAFLGAVAGDFVRYFTPGATPYADVVSATSLPAAIYWEALNERIRRRLIPAAHPTVQSPAAFMRGYRRVIHVPRPVLAILALAVVVAVALRTAARREILLLGGTALLLLVGTSATAGFGLRYLLPTVPLFLIGGGLAARDLFALRDARNRHTVHNFLGYGGRLY
jgi:hypothetical protein